MMAASEIEAGLPQRLERLRGGEAECDLPSYVEIAKEVRASPGFQATLSRSRALADPNRLLAAALLRRRKELCACEIQAATGLRHATVSHHMSILAAAGLVSERKRGKWMYYRLVGPATVRLP